MTLEREIIENRSFNDQTITSLLRQCPDTSSLSLLDVDPQSNGSQGKVYDLDAPGINSNPASPIDTINRRRTNFRQWGTVFQMQGTNAAAVRVSDDINWYQRISIKKTGQNTSVIINDVANDNIISAGTTPLTWDLGSNSGTLPSPSACPQ